MWLPLHRRALGVANGKGKSLIEAVEKYKDWSGDLCIPVICEGVVLCWIL